MKRAVIKIFGDVQGVFFRVNTTAQAQELGLTGWVRNAQDGTVEIVAEGSEEMLKKLIDWCYNGQREKNIGFANVDKVEVKWEEGIREFQDFIIKYN